MSLDSIGLPRSAEPVLTRPVELTCFALCVAHLAFLVSAYMQGSWLVAPDGHRLATDFVNVWASGHQVLAGHAAAVYDDPLHKAAEVATIGTDFPGEYPWVYPPSFLFAATALALLPYGVAYASWILLTFPLYAVTVRSIVGHRAGFLFAAAFPGILSNIMVGQNGFLTAALIGSTLLLMERRPVLAGCLLGLLSFKPHFGILFPIALIAGAHWRTIGAAAVVTLLLAAASWLAFGTDAWQAFFHALPMASQDSLTDGRADWAKLQSVFGLARALGGGNSLAWALQGGLTCTIALLLAVIWRSRIAYDLKAAALSAGVLLATPYIFLYDLVTLAVPMAFLIRIGWRTGFLAFEITGLVMASLLILIFPLVTAPVGFGAVVVVTLLIARRIFFRVIPETAPAVVRNL
jgi:hypothetical protein